MRAQYQDPYSPIINLETANGEIDIILAGETIATSKKLSSTGQIITLHKSDEYHPTHPMAIVHKESIELILPNNFIYQDIIKLRRDKARIPVSLDEELEKIIRAGRMKNRQIKFSRCNRDIDRDTPYNIESRRDKEIRKTSRKQLSRGYRNSHSSPS